MGTGIGMRMGVGTGVGTRVGTGTGMGMRTEMGYQMGGGCPPQACRQETGKQKPAHRSRDRWAAALGSGASRATSGIPIPGALGRACGEGKGQRVSA